MDERVRERERERERERGGNGWRNLPVEKTGKETCVIQKKMFTFQVTRLHERHLPEHRLQRVSHLPHIT